jgi:hypothetical protein
MNHMKEPGELQVELRKPHTHAGKLHQPGDRIWVTPDVAQWLFDNRIIKMLPGQKSDVRTQKSGPASDLDLNTGLAQSLPFMAGSSETK